MRKPWYSIFYIKSPIMKILAGTISLIIALLALGFQLVVEEPRMAAQTANWDGRSIEKGAELYKNNCANCHGSFGQGQPGPALNNEYFFTQRLKDLSYAGSVKSYIALTVAAGRPNRINNQWGVMMPTWGNKYGGPMRDDQVEHVVNFVANWQRTPLDPEDLSKGYVEGPYENQWIPFRDGSDPSHPVRIIDANALTDTVAGPPTPQQLFVSMACAGCHKMDLDQTTAAPGVPAPNMKNLHETAATKVAGLIAEDYVYQSIVEPNAYVNEGYVAGIMPQDFKTKMSEEEIRSLVAWILDPNRVMP